MGIHGLFNNSVTIRRVTHSFQQGERQESLSQVATGVACRITVEDPSESNAEAEVGGQQLPVPRLRAYFDASTDIQEEDEIEDRDGLKARVLYTFDFHRMGRYLAAVCERVKR